MSQDGIQQVSEYTPILHSRAPSISVVWRRMFPFLLLIPALALLGVFIFYPLVYGFYFSFERWDGFTNPTFVGVKNYAQALHDSIFWKSLGHNTIYALVSVVLKMIIGMGLAMLVNQKMRVIGAYRTLIFIPVVLSFVAVGMLWSWIYNPVFGLLDNFLHLMGIKHSIPWLGNAHTVLGSIIAVDVWKWSGYHMILFLAGLQSIPSELYEAASVDGATKWGSFFRITFPLMIPVLVINSTLAFMGGFTVFDLVYTMTQGGPYNASSVTSLYSYQQAFQFHNFGYGTAISYLLMLVVIIITFVQFRLTRRFLN